VRRQIQTKYAQILIMFHVICAGDCGEMNMPEDRA
jgi:hypothetical protein